MKKTKVAMFWSGGKDSAMALHTIRLLYPDLEVYCLVTTINEHYRRVSMHGVREELLELQAESIGIPLWKMYVSKESSNEEYEQRLHQILLKLKEEGINQVIFGDIFLEDLKLYREQLLEKANMIGVFPLWKKPTDKLIMEFIAKKFKTITCCVNDQYLDKTWVGREINTDFINALPSTVDPCGENGEFHTFCFEGPIFKQKIEFYLGEKIYKPIRLKTTESNSASGFWFVDLIPNFKALG